MLVPSVQALVGLVLTCASLVHALPLMSPLSKRAIGDVGAHLTALLKGPRALHEYQATRYRNLADSQTQSIYHKSQAKAYALWHDKASEKASGTWLSHFAKGNKRRPNWDDFEVHLKELEGNARRGREEETRLQALGSANVMGRYTKEERQKAIRDAKDVGDEASFHEQTAGHLRHFLRSVHGKRPNKGDRLERRKVSGDEQIQGERRA